MAPPAKRLKRNVIPSSPPSQLEATPISKAVPERTKLDATKKEVDIYEISSDIDEASPFFKPAKAPPKPARQSTLNLNGSRNTSASFLPPPSSRNAVHRRSASASLSPEKKKQRLSKPTEKGKNGNLHIFFSAQVQKQRDEHLSRRGPAHSGASEAINEEDISTDDDDHVVETKTKQISSFTSTASKRTRSALSDAGSSIVSSSQRFKKPDLPSSNPKLTEDLRPWADRFPPLNLNELAVHKRKVQDVRDWLQGVMAGKIRKSVLILKGSAGTGKTATIKLLANAMRVEVLEWRNPIGSMNTSEGNGFISTAEQFEEFVGRGGKFAQLDIFSDVKSTSVKSEPIEESTSPQNLLLVEEFPNTFTRSSSMLDGFRNSILQYLAANTISQSVFYSGQKPAGGITPLVMVISENLLTTTSAAADSFTAHRLLGPEILHHPGVSVIEFNKIAPTFLQKALETVVVKESRISGRRKTPGPQVLKRLGEIGDIRSAIGSLEFLCVQGDDADWGAHVNFSGKKKRGEKDVELTPHEAESLELVTRREASLGIFHAVGRVCYNNRNEEAKEVLPPHLALSKKSKKPDFEVDALIDETGTDTSTFLSAIHENYVLSCGDNADQFPFFSDVHRVDTCISALSDADMLSPSWDGSFGSTGFGGGSGGRNSGGDVNRQDELSFQVGVRGVLFGLPENVKRIAPKQAGFRTGNGREGHQMFYPTSIKLWRQQQEIESLLDLSVTRIMKGEQKTGGIISDAAAFMKSKSGVETWSSNYASSSRPAGCPQRRKTSGVETTEPVPVLVGLGRAAKKEMLLERLPYLVKISHISRNRSAVSLPLPVSELEKVTKFTGIAPPTANSEEAEAEGDGDVAAMAENWATDKPTDGGSPQKRRIAERGKLSGSRGNAKLLAAQEHMEKTVLSDDDIED